MSLKKIQYNPNNIPNKQKTRKVNKPILINENSLKAQLINRIKKHKQSEGTNANTNTINKKELKKNKHNPEPEPTFTDDFNDSINYLSNLSKKHKETNKTLKHSLSGPSPSPSPSPSPVHSLHVLPDELQEVFPILERPNFDRGANVDVDVDVDDMVMDVDFKIPFIQNNYTVDNQVPYGCLKNGLKPTYKQFTKKQPIFSERERKLQELKQKYKQNMINVSANNGNDLTIPDMIATPITGSTATSTSIATSTPSTTKIIKKSICKKYTLGKSNILRKVSVLIKNNDTRKKIIIAQKELKKKSIHDIKKYLKEHFLLKSGSSAPNEVLRKMYESVMLSGDIINNNKETIVHNFMNE